MKIKFFLLAVVFFLSGCDYKTAENSTSVGVDFKVEKLFTHEGCSVYRFYDGFGVTSARYYTNCNSVTWQESCGKHCTSDMEISGK